MDSQADSPQVYIEPTPGSPSDSSEGETESLSDSHSIRPEILTVLSHLDLSAHFDDFKESKVVDAGTYGDVSSASCILPQYGKTKVAVKRLRFYIPEDISMVRAQVLEPFCRADRLFIYIKLFQKEIYVWAKLNHPNVLPLLGYFFEKKTGYPLLVSKWMENGPAWSYVRRTDCDLNRLVCLQL